MRAIRRIIAALFGLIALYLLAALVGAVIPGKIVKTGDSSGATEILLISGPIHYDFLLPLNDETRAHFGFLNDAGHEIPTWADWLVIGWGAREFYTTTGNYGDVNANAIWRGIFGDQSVMRVEFAGPLNPDLDFIRLTLTDAQYRRLLQATSDSFADPIVRLDHPGFSTTDAFFAANGAFNIFATCNTWITGILRRAGVPTGIWTPTPFSVRLSLWRR